MDEKKKKEKKKKKGEENNGVRRITHKKPRPSRECASAGKNQHPSASKTLPIAGGKGRGNPGQHGAQGQRVSMSYRKSAYLLGWGGAQKGRKKRNPLFIGEKRLKNNTNGEGGVKREGEKLGVRR